MRKLVPPLAISILLVLSSGCIQFGEEDMTREDEMRDLVLKVTSYARDRDPDFVVIVANGEDLATDDGRTAKGYLNTIDGVAREDLYFGASGMDSPNPWPLVESMAAKLNRSVRAGNMVMVVDHCSKTGFVWDSMEWAQEMGFLYFASDSPGTGTIPPYPADPPDAHREDVTDLSDARNHGVVFSAEEWRTKESYLAALRKTNYDVLVIDAFFNDTPLTSQEVDSLRTKKDGGTRLVIAVLGLGELDTRQYLWKDVYETMPPGWLGNRVQGKDGRYRVHYWEKSWRMMVYKSDDSWLDKILAAGFDGMYLAGGDAHLYS